MNIESKINPESILHRPLIISLAWDIALNATIPVACTSWQNGSSRNRR